MPSSTGEESQLPHRPTASFSLSAAGAIALPATTDATANMTARIAGIIDTSLVR
jgi:hypothetical protein